MLDLVWIQTPGICTESKLDIVWAMEQTLDKYKNNIHNNYAMGKFSHCGKGKSLAIILYILSILLYFHTNEIMMDYVGD